MLMMAISSSVTQCYHCHRTNAFAYLLSCLRCGVHRVRLLLGAKAYWQLLHELFFISITRFFDAALLYDVTVLLLGAWVPENVHARAGTKSDLITIYTSYA